MAVRVPEPPQRCRESQGRRRLVLKDPVEASAEVVVVRRRRAVLIDDFSFYLGWPKGDNQTFSGLTVSSPE